jgi:Ca2+:H+ antiporter
VKFSMRPRLDWLIVFVPISIWLEYSRPELHGWIFICACLGILPLAGWLGHATERIAARSGDAIGGLLNATFGNAAEFIIALAGLRQGLYGVVKASLTGSIIGNLLLVAGLSLLAGGLKFKVQRFNAVGARMQSTLLTLAAIGLIMPAAFHHIAGPSGYADEKNLGVEIALVLLAAYAASLVFSLRTHKFLFGGEAPAEHHLLPRQSLWKAVGLLAAAAALIAWMSEILVSSVAAASAKFGMTQVFVGLIVVAIIGNAAEHSTAVVSALKNKMDLSLGIAIGSSVQIALFVAPALVIASHFIGPQPMDLVFSSGEVLAVVLAVFIASQIGSDGESNWLEGALLLAVYAILGITFYFMPEGAIHAGALGTAQPVPGH